jgi:hypothetical protein
MNTASAWTSAAAELSAVRAVGGVDQHGSGVDERKAAISTVAISTVAALSTELAEDVQGVDGRGDDVDGRGVSSGLVAVTAGW